MANITIEGTTKVLTLKSLVEFEAEQTWRNHTQTAKLKIPRKIYFQNKDVKDLIVRGNPISVKIGYGDRNFERLVERFNGYIAYVSNEVPLLLELEDAMFKQKQTAVAPKVFSNATLDDVLKYCGITNYKALGTYSLGKFSITKDETNVAKVFEKLSKYGIYIWYRNGVLMCGNPYSGTQNAPIPFQIGGNIEKSDLQYRTAAEIKLLVTCKSKDSKTSKVITAQAGDQEGEKRTFDGYFNLTKDELQKQANEMLQKMKYDGYRGAFTAWGEPVVNEGDIVQLIDPNYPDRDGNYWVDKVEPKSGGGGIRQKIELGLKI